MTYTNAIPFLDLVTVHGELREELLGIFGAALETGGFIGGPMVEEFEQEFAKFCGTKYCVGVGSGTDAVRFALMADGIERNDIVLTVPNTFIATAEAISQAGGVPDFVDVDELTYNLSPEKLREYLEVQCRVDANGRVVHRASGRRVTTVVPVHLYGQPAEMDAILEIAQQYNLSVIEDACQAHGAEYFSAAGGRWRKAGSMGHAAASSFYPGKNLGACGEAGAITTDDGELARRVRMLRDHGQVRKYYHETEGYNGRLDAIQAGILRVKLKYLADWNAKRRQAADLYRELFEEAGSGQLPPFAPEWAKSVYHLYVIRVPNREGLMRHLAEARIGTGIHYPVPLHLQEAYRELGYKAGDFPVAERAAKEIVSLPMYPGLAEAQQARVVEQVVEFMRLAESGVGSLAVAVG